MAEHLSRERIAALLDGLEAGSPDRQHVEGCEACMHEYEQMARIRMALSALPDLEPPAEEWNRIRQHIDARAAPDVLQRGPTSRLPSWLPPRVMWAAGVIGLFAAGLGVGRQAALNEARLDGRSATAELATLVPQEAEAEDSRTEAYLRTVAEMERLRREGATGPAAWSDPSAATERLMKLDALIEASREALRTAPTDPALNDFLFDVVDERESLAGQLNRSLRYTSVEY